MGKLTDHKAAVAEIVGRVALREPAEREIAVGQLIILAGLRSLEETVEKEIRKMPILNDILDHKVLGREFRKGRDEGLQEGRQEGRRAGLKEGLQAGRQEGRREGELTLLVKILRERFGEVPAWAEQLLRAKPPAELDTLSDRLLTVRSIDELLR